MEHLSYQCRSPVSLDLLAAAIQGGRSYLGALVRNEVVDGDAKMSGWVRR